MELQTKIPIPKGEVQIDYESQLLLLGSCFSENMGQKLQYAQFRTHVNPFGILFHPLAIAKMIGKVLQGERYTEADFFERNGLWHCFDVHSSMDANSPSGLQQGLHSALEFTGQQLKQASHIFITLGTAWVYRYLKIDALVANCHKIPQQEFRKELLSIQEIEEALAQLVDQIKEVNPKAQIIFTISPVRHIKDGFVENQRSKAHLFAALHAVLETIGARVHYFPAYELFMDELRDYRYYAEDMVHPNALGIQYVWERFTVTWISEASYAVMDRVAGIRKGLAHKPFNPASVEHRQFRQELAKKIAYLQQEYPFMHFEE